MTDSATITMSLEEAIRARHGVCIATIKHDYNVCHSIYTYSKVTICPDVPLGEYTTISAGAAVTKDIPAMRLPSARPPKSLKCSTQVNSRSSHKPSFKYAKAHRLQITFGSASFICFKSALRKCRTFLHNENAGRETMIIHSLHLTSST